MGFLQCEEMQFEIERERKRTMQMEELNGIVAPLSDSEVMAAGAIGAGVILTAVVVLGMITLC
jgi:hypothetical protein